MASWFFLTGLLHSPHGNLGLPLPFAGPGFDDISPQTSRSRCIWKVLAPFVLYWTLPAKYRHARERRMKGALTTCFSRKNASEALILRSTCEYGQIVSLYSKVRSGNTRMIAQRARIKPKLRALNIAHYSLRLSSVTTLSFFVSALQVVFLETGLLRRNRQLL